MDKKRILQIGGLLLATVAVMAAAVTLSGSGEKNTEVFRHKAELLRGSVLQSELLEEFPEAPAGEAGYAVFFSVCNGTERAKVYHSTGGTAEQAWENAERAAERALAKSDLIPYWVKADLAYVSAPLSADAVGNIGAAFGSGNFRFGLVFDPYWNSAVLEAELNCGKMYDYENGTLDLGQINACLAASGQPTLSALPEEYTAFQCGGWFCDENDQIVQLSPEEPSYGRRSLPAVDQNTAAALMLDAAGYLAGQVQEDGSILASDGQPLDAARQAEAISAMVQAYFLTPENTGLTGGINRALSSFVEKVAFAQEDLAFLPVGDEITLESCALGAIALADCADATGSEECKTAAVAMGGGILAMLDSQTGAFTHALDANNLNRKPEARDPAWDGMAVTALCRIYGLTEDTMWLWSASQAMNHLVAENTAGGEAWFSYAANAITEYVADRPEYFVFALQNAQRSLADIYSAETTSPAGLETLMATYECYHRMLGLGLSAEGFEPQLLLQVIQARAERQLDGYLFPEFAMYFDEPQRVLGTFMTREKGLGIYIDDICRNIRGYSMYAQNYNNLASDGMVNE